MIKGYEAIVYLSGPVPGLLKRIAREVYYWYTIYQYHALKAMIETPDYVRVLEPVEPIKKTWLPGMREIPRR